MPFKEFPCPICQGQKIIDLGNEINDVQIESEQCPACSGVGYVTVEFHIYSFDEKTWKRLTGQNE